MKENELKKTHKKKKNCWAKEKTKMSDLLEQLSAIQGEKGKKGKKAKKQAAKSSSDSKQKVIVLQSLEQLQQLDKKGQLNFSNVQKSNDDNDTQEKVQTYNEETKSLQHAIIVAATTIRLEVGDIRNIFTNLTITRIIQEPSYFLVDFGNEEDRKAAIKKNKLQFRTGVVLVDEYDESQEDPAPTHTGGYGGGYGGGYDNSSYGRPEYGVKTYVPKFGERKQQPNPEDYVPNYDDERPRRDFAGYGSRRQNDSYGYGGYGRGGNYGDRFGGGGGYGDAPRDTIRIGERKQQPAPPSTPAPSSSSGTMSWMERRRLEKAAAEAAKAAGNN